jgi:hypothetical protein
VLGPGVDVRYEVAGGVLKEEIVLARRPVSGRFAFALELDGLTAKQLPDGSIGLWPAPGDTDVAPLLVLPAPFMFDSRPEASSPYGSGWSPAVSQTLRRVGERLLVVVEADQGCCVTVFHFREGDPFTEAIRELESIWDARALIAADIVSEDTSGTADFHYSELTPAERRQVAIDNALGAASFGMYGMPTVQAFLGSYDLQWNVIGYDESNSPIVEFHLTNASTRASGAVDPNKVQEYAEGSAGDGHDAQPGEHWQQQSVRSREVFPGGNVPHPTPEPGFLLPGGTAILDLCAGNPICPDRLPSLW